VFKICADTCSSWFSVLSTLSKMDMYNFYNECFNYRNIFQNHMEQSVNIIPLLLLLLLLLYYYYYYIIIIPFWRRKRQIVTMFTHLGWLLFKNRTSQVCLQNSQPISEHTIHALYFKLKIFLPEVRKIYIYCLYFILTTTPESNISKQKDNVPAWSAEKICHLLQQQNYVIS
jgi:hypothetical protein